MSDNRDLSSTVRDTLQRHRGEQRGVEGTLVLDREEAFVGDELTVQGRDLPADRSLDLVWHTLDGEWGILQANEVMGPQYSGRRETLTTVRTDDSGRFEATFEVPRDYGGGHTVEVRDGDDVLGRTEVEIRAWFEVESTTAPLGETFTVRGYGIGPNPVTNNYQVAWDNGTVGYMTGVMNDGSATARIRAVGPTGKHDLQVWRSYRGFPFLQNNTQSPYGPVGRDRQNAWTVKVTEPESRPPAAWTDELFEETPLPVHYPDIDRETAATLDVTPESGTPGTEATIRGEAFPANEMVDLVWYRHEGKRIEGDSITPEPNYDALPTVETDADGRFAVDVEIPTDIGSTRPITAEVGGDSVAVTGFMMQPEVLDITPEKGPVGTEIEIKIQGVGWTLYENTPFFVYDNKLLGYVCGNNDDDSHGVVRTKLRASGDPGLHFIDVYPAIFEMRDEEPDFECKPHLSYLDNHPVRPLPAHHFTFEVTEE